MPVFFIAGLLVAIVLCFGLVFARRKVTVFYATVTGKSRTYAEQLATQLKSHSGRLFTVQLVNLDSFDPEDRLQFEDVCLFLVSTISNGSLPQKCRWFFTWLDDAASDFRYDHGSLRKLRFAVFGLGDSAYGPNYNRLAKSLRTNLLRLEAKEIVPLKLADESCGPDDGADEAFDQWAKNVVQKLASLENKMETVSAPVSKFVKSEEDEVEQTLVNEEVADLEDFLLSSATKQGSEPREMISPSLRQSLTKQGYRLIGSHSGVKLCRWTKSMLRGRGGCYKNAFYGISSHQCMELTPSLACANKCVFCWRHHSNPVGTRWIWKVDDPEFIFREAIKQHLTIMKENRGLPGVRQDRLTEAHTVKHCALSLVGEPIMFPKINQFLDILHRHRISTFLVTNAQFPEAIRELQPVTQLYASIDAATEEGLKQIDRPLFRDFWKRFLDSLVALKHKKQRTVYRLTLIKGYNETTTAQYAELIERGRPDFVEIKGVTYCGTSKDSLMTMANVPWHSEVVSFGAKLMEFLKDYEIAAEHKHSNCILLAKSQFKIDGVWHTWIDFAKFHELYEQFALYGKRFSSMDYVAPTPTWALFESEEHGFNPADVRWYRKNRKTVLE